MKPLIAAVGALILAGGATAAVAQTTQDRIDAAVSRARQAGIPVALLESKVAEGKAKGVSMDRIAVAVERREAALEKASQALGRPDDGPANLSVAADAVESGVSAAVLKATADAAPRDRRVVAIAALTELVRQGTLPEAALARVKDALKRGPEALANLPAQAAGGQGQGQGQGQGNAGAEPAGNQGAGKGQGRGAQGPPASVPAPGGSSEPTKPNGKPSDPGNSNKSPGPPPGRGRSGQ
jgi:hypothetical protein